MIAAVLVAASTAAANAAGLTRIQQNDGSVRTYRDVSMTLSGQTLRIRSGDRRGTLTVTNGACSFTGNLQRCLPYAMTLRQNGRTHAIALEHGVVFLNLTASPQRLRRSSEIVPARAVLVLVKTQHGTYVTVKGTLDEVVS